jgi:hypothetical protein
VQKTPETLQAITDVRAAWDADESEEAMRAARAVAAKAMRSERSKSRKCYNKRIGVNEISNVV